ncbi:MAG: hypothetical protein H6812_01030 [Phycisphaeraceae bacterium]|nr:hypothetical protein [Phycisphaerales bacterium]MCB9841817.1 hypothetical protein [Phycisphaeraceae bacterium]
MSRVYSVASRASRRILIRNAVSLTGPALAIGAGVALLATLIDRLIGPGLAWWMILAPASLIPAMIASLLAWRRRGSRLGALASVDASLRLEDRLGSAASFTERRDDNPFAQLAIDEGERTAGDVRVDRAIPIRFDNSWFAAGLMLLVALGALLFVEPMHLLRDNAAHEANIHRIAQQEQAADEIDEVAGALEQLSTDGDAALADTPGAQDALAELEKLREELARGETDADEARSQAAESLNDLAQGLEQSAQESRAADDAVREMFSQLPPKDTPSGASERLADALRSGDLDGALEALNELEQQAGDLPPEQREDIARDLRALADDLEELTAQQQNEQQPLDDIEPAPDETGLTPQERDELRDMGDAQQIEEALRQRGFDQEPARQLAEQLEQEHKDQQAQKQAEQRTRDLSDAARDAADDIEQKPKNDSSNNNQSQNGDQPKQQGDQQGDNKQQQDGGSKPDDRKQGTGESPDPNAPGAPTPAETPAKQETQGGKPQPQQQGEPSQGQPQQQQPGQQQPTQGSDPSQQGDQPANQQGDKPGDQPGAQPNSEQGSPTDSQQPGQQQPGAKDGAQPGQGDPAQSTDSQSPGDGSQQGEQNSDQTATGTSSETSAERDPNQGAGQGGDKGGTGVQRLREQLEEIRDEARRAKQNQQRADDIRDRARELLDGMSDDERQRMLDWAEQLARENNAPPDDSFAAQSRDRPPIDASNTSPMDIRRNADDGRVVGEFDDPNSRTGAGDVSDRAPTPAEIRKALEGLDQLVEDRAVPRSRQSVIERYFRKALERAEKEQAEQPAESSPPPAPAKDADG